MDCADVVPVVRNGARNFLAPVVMGNEYTVVLPLSKGVHYYLHIENQWPDFRGRHKSHCARAGNYVADNEA